MGRRGLGHRVKSVPKDRLPLCVGRLLEGAEAGRGGWLTALPPSLDLEIRAIQQVGSASMEALHVSLCRPSLWPEKHLVIACPSPAFSALAPALKTPRPCSLTSSLNNLWFLHTCSKPFHLLFYPSPTPVPPSPLSCLGPHFSLALPGSHTASASRSRM